MTYTGNLYIPYDNSFCINCRNGKNAMLVSKDPSDLYYIGPDKEEDGANFEIVTEPYEEKIYFEGLRSYTFINVKSSKTGNIYRTLFTEHRVI